MEGQVREEPVPSPLDLPAFLPYACKRLQAPFYVYVKERTDAEPKDRKSKQSKRESYPSQTQAFVDVPSKVSYTLLDPHTIIITIVRDTLGRISHMIFSNCKQIPSLLLKVIGLCMPFQLYLTKISIRWGPFRGFDLKEIASFLSKSYLTEVCLDDSPLPQGNFHILLEANTPLRRLSLARCNIDDEVCTLIVAKLAYLQPAAKSLVSLVLTSNFITDNGAKAIGNTLRSNRSLLHLDVAGNYITDEGSAYILETLMNFPLTEEEVTMINKRHIQQLVLRLHDNCVRVDATQTEAKALVVSTSQGRHQRKGKGRRAKKGSLEPNYENFAAQDIRAVKNELGETPSNPFSIDKTYTQNGKTYSIGNMRLAYLNMAYNNLEYFSAKLLHRVVSYQVTKKQVETREASVLSGLVRIVLDGNAMPKHCQELRQVQALLEQPMITKPSKTRQKRTSR